MTVVRRRLDDCRYSQGGNALCRYFRRALFAVALVFAAACGSASLLADEPYARSRDYDLQHSKIALRFSVPEKEVMGDVIHTVSILRDNTAKVSFDSVGLAIRSVTVDRVAARFETTDAKLVVFLPDAAKAGQRFEIEIKYDGKPSKGLYFILPDAAYPKRPIQVWTQGESEDTRFYLPTYDYPNDRLTTETILTVPASWQTVANGKLVSVTDAGKGLKTWTWKEALPSSTYLITVVAGEFDEVKDSWHGIPVNYFAPRGRGDRLSVNYGRTPAMLELLSKRFGVDYPWEKYDQAMVDDFVAGGMENSSATTNTAESLTNPQLVPEYITNQDDLISHELTHQWFGDLVTCKAWSDVWLNEGFATFGETLWNEAHYGKDLADYNRWQAAREWFHQTNLFSKPIVRHDFSEDSDEFDGNAYGKGAWVLDMLRYQLGEDAFYAGLKHYLEANRGKNVLTSDFAKAIEEATHVNIDQFLGQWIYGPGAPRLDISYTYDEAKHQVALTVKQTQKQKGSIGTFRVPVEIEITSATGTKLYPLVIGKDPEKDADIFDLPSDSAPLLVLFDKGGHVLKSADFHKEKKEWLYQLKNSPELGDRADAVVALAKLSKDDQAIAAVGEAMLEDKTWGLRSIAIEALGHVDTAAASKLLLEALDKSESSAPDAALLARYRIVAALGTFKDPAVAARLEMLAREDKSYRARGAALEALGHLKSPNAFATLSAAVAADSPDDFLRNAALRAFGSLGDNNAVPALREWSAIGKPVPSRSAAISSLGHLDKDNPAITQLLTSYLSEPHFSIRIATISALGNRGDASAVPALEALLSNKDLSIEMVPLIKTQISHLQNKSTKNMHEADEDAPASPTPAQSATDNTERLERIERLTQEMNDRLKAIESRLPAATKNP
ncbi:MAG: M1 family aminopeptidase [Candidatus Acidiferrum sp.]|jgi:aminopeptidase N